MAYIEIKATPSRQSPPAPMSRSAKERRFWNNSNIVPHLNVGYISHISCCWEQWSSMMDWNPELYEVSHLECSIEADDFNRFYLVCMVDPKKLQMRMFSNTNGLGQTNCVLHWSKLGAILLWNLYYVKQTSTDSMKQKITIGLARLSTGAKRWERKATSMDIEIDHVADHRTVLQRRRDN